MYRSDIDGLRAVAVVVVLLFHAKLGLPGGFVGVDVFFVISGFLITRILLKEYNSANGVNLLNFWERRVRRIFPALLFVLVLTVVIGWFVFLPSAYYNLAKSIIAQAFFAGNFYFYFNQGYFTESVNPEPLLHTWSLAVEEQFYILFPFLFLVIPNSNRYGLRIAVVFLAAISILFSFAQVKYSPDAAFFLLPSRAWELIAGSLLAIFYKESFGSRVLFEISAWIGIVSIALCCFLCNKETPFPGLAAIPPVLGAVAVIWSGGRIGQKTTLERILSLQPMVFLGKISYSLYLWHLPVFVYATYWQDNLILRWPIRVALVILCILLAAFTWRWIETPFRKSQYCQSRRKILLFAVLFPVIALVSGLVLHIWQGWPQRFPEIINHIDNAPRPDSLNVNDSDISLISNLESAKNGIFYEVGNYSNPVELIVWGDSHAMAIKPAMENLALKNNSRIQIAAHPATCPILGYDSFHKTSLLEKSQAWNAAVFENIKKRSIPNVLLVANWPWYYSFQRQKSDGVYSELIANEFGYKLAETVNELIQAGKKVWILECVPSQSTDFRKQMVKSILAGDTADVGVSLKDALLISRQQEKVFQKAVDAGAILLDPLPFFFVNSDKCQLFYDEKLTYLDSDHISPTGAILIEKLFDRILE
jgi:peptidoglycan/LPS O-acetylase OafA/YrhL